MTTRDTKKSRKDNWEALIGLGKQSMSKSYYPELQSRLEELEHFRALLENINDTILVVDSESETILDVTGAAEIMIGCGSNVLVGQQFAKLLPEHMRIHVSSLLNPLAGESTYESTFRCPSCDGAKAVPVELGTRIVEQDGKNITVIIARDISRRKKAEEAVRKLNLTLENRVRQRTRELAEANQAKTDYLNFVSHEMRTPVTAIIGFAKLIKRSLTRTSDGRETQSHLLDNLEIIIAEADRLTGLINDLMDLAKLEAGKIEYRMESIDLNEVVAQSVSSVQPLYDAKKLPLERSIPGTPIWITGDHDRLMQVMVNLLSNALKFTMAGNVQCGIDRDQDRILVSVADTGMGIPEDKLEAIFDRFAQVGDHALGGTGLGLPICRLILEAHGGKIWAESTPGEGSTFRVTLPLSN